MYLGFILAALAGILISIQGALNSNINMKIGNLETVVVAHFLGLIAALIAVMLFGRGDFKKIAEVNPFYLIAGPLGVIIVYGFIESISLLGAAVAVGIILISQLSVAVLIDTFGLFGLPKVKFDITKVVGIVLMLIGIIVFRWKK